MTYSMNRAQGAARMVANMLERDGSPVRIEASQELMSAVAELVKQRDKLLAALERIAAGPGSNRLSTAIEWAKDAIASVKGESK